MNRRDMKKELWIELSEEVGTMSYALEQRIKRLMPNQTFTNASRARCESLIDEIITEMRAKGVR
mgnify:FL=1